MSHRITGTTALVIGASVALAIGSSVGRAQQRSAQDLTQAAVDGALTVQRVKVGLSVVDEGGELVALGAGGAADGSALADERATAEQEWIRFEAETPNALPDQRRRALDAVPLEEPAVARVAAVRELAAPDLVITDVERRDGTVAYRVENQWLADAGAFDVGIYLSTDPLVDTDDARVGSERVAGLPAGAAYDGAIAFAVPSGTAAGTYFVGALADPDDVIPERNASDTAEQNNGWAGDVLEWSPPGESPGSAIARRVGTSAAFGSSPTTASRRPAAQSDPVARKRSFAGGGARRPAPIGASDPVGTSAFGDAKRAASEVSTADAASQATNDSQGDAIAGLELPDEAMQSGLGPDEIVDAAAKLQMLGADDRIRDGRTWDGIRQNGLDGVLADVISEEFGLPDGLATGKSATDLLQGIGDLQAGGRNPGSQDAWDDYFAVLSGDMSVADFVGGGDRGSGSDSGSGSQSGSDSTGTTGSASGGTGGDAPNFGDDDPFGSRGGSSGSSSGQNSGGSTPSADPTGTGTGTSDPQGGSSSSTSGSGGSNDGQGGYTFGVTHNSDGGFTVTVEDAAGNTASATFVPDGKGGYVNPETGQTTSERPAERTYSGTADGEDAVIDTESGSSDGDSEGSDADDGDSDAGDDTDPPDPDAGDADGYCPAEDVHCGRQSRPLTAEEEEQARQEACAKRGWVADGGGSDPCAAPDRAAPVTEIQSATGPCGIYSYCVEGSSGADIAAPVSGQPIWGQPAPIDPPRVEQGGTWGGSIVSGSGLGLRPGGVPRGGTNPVADDGF